MYEIFKHIHGTSFQLLYDNHDRRYVAEISRMRRKTLYNQSINHMTIMFI